MNKLHIGCGSHFLSERGWLDTDIEPKAEHVQHLDAAETFPFNDGSFTHVFSEHMIEHIQFIPGQHMLRECFRVLAPGGRVRIATPDLYFLVRMWLDGPLTAVQRDYLAFKKQDTCHLFNDFMREGGLHQFIYDKPTLHNALQEAGFVDVKLCELMKSEDHELRDLEYADRMPHGFLALESMVMEGTRP